MRLFYLESHGVPRAARQRMVVQDFFGEVVDSIPFEQAGKLVEEELEARLG
jgi:Fe-S cluster assembly scaffold protein SufB